MTRLAWEVLHLVLWETVACIAIVLSWRLIVGEHHEAAMVWLLIAVVGFSSWRTGRWHNRMDAWEQTWAELGPRRSAYWKPDDEEAR